MAETISYARLLSVCLFSAKRAGTWAFASNFKPLYDDI